MSRSKNVKRGIYSGLLFNTLAIILPFVSRTIIIYYLGNAYVGLGGLFSSILQVLNITELGFGGAISYLLYKPIAENNTKRVCQILSFARISFKTIGVVVFISGLIILPFIEKIISGGHPLEINIYVLYILYLINSVVSYFMFSYKRVLFSACQRTDIETNINTITVIAQYVLQIIVLLLTNNYYLYVVIMIISSIINNLLCQYETKRKYPDYYCAGNIIDKDKIELIKTMKGVFASKLGSTVLTASNNVIVSYFFGLIILGQFTNYYYVITALIGIFAVVHNSLRPSIGNYKIVETKERNFQLFNNISVIYNWIAAFCTCCLLCLLQDLIYVWLGSSSQFPQYYAILFSISFYFGRLSCIPNIYVEASGLWYESKYIYFIAAIVNLLLSLILVFYCGLPGVLYSSIITSVFVCAGGYVYVLFYHYFKFNSYVLRYYKNMIVHFIIQTVIIGIVYWFSLCLDVNSWLMLFLKSLIVSLAFIILLILVSSIYKGLIVEYFDYAKSVIKR